MLIFLDFDGVLHPRAGTDPFQVSCLTALARALEPFEARIVITSTWREEIPPEHLYQKLALLNKEVIGSTPIIDEPFLLHVRYHEVLLYHEHLPSEPWLAIDDTPAFFPVTTPVYLTDPLTGFTTKDISPLQQVIRTQYRNDPESKGAR